MAKKAGLELIISLVDEASSGMEKITGSMKGLALIGGAAAATAIVAVGKAAFDAGLVYDEAMDTIITKTGASGDALAGLGEDFKAVFGSVPTDAQSAADVIAELNRKVGMTGPILQETSKQLLEMSRMLGGDASSNAALFGRVMGDWSITADQAGGALDKMFVATQETGVGVDSLMQKVVQFGAPLRNMGFSFEESVALLASFEKEGVNTELVLGSLRIAAGKFAKEGKPLKESLMATFDAIKNNTDASAALAQGMEVFGARAGPDMVAAIREGRFSVDDLTTAMGSAEGAILKTADATADFPEKFAVLKNKVTELLMPLGSLMVSGLTAAVDAIGPATDSAITWIGKVTGEGTTLGNLWNTLQTIAQTVWPQVQAIIVGAIAVIQGVLGGHAEGLSSTLGPAWEGIQAIIERVWPIIQGIIAAGTAIVQGFIDEHGAEIVAFMQITWDKISEIIDLAWQLISAILAVVVPAVRDLIVPIFEAIQLFLTEHGDTIKTVLGAAWNIIKEIINIALAVIKGAIKVALAIIKGDWQGAWDAIKNMLESVWDSIKNIVQSGLDAIVGILKDIELPNPFAALANYIDKLRDTIEDFLRWLGGLKIPNPFSGLTLPGFAGGMVAAGQATTVGGNTFVFNFAAASTAYDERRVEAAVERAMLRSGVRADVLRRTR